MACIKRAILSVYQKEGIVEFAEGLNALSVESLSSSVLLCLALKKRLRLSII